MESMTIGIIYANGIMEEMLMVNLYIYISCLENSISDLIILDFNENRGWASRFNERIYSRKLTAGIITAPFSS